MKKGLGYFAIAFAVFALTACDSSTSNPADAGQAQVQTETGENQPGPGNDGNEDYSSSSFALPESSETTVPESAESTEPTSTESSETALPESSESVTPESAETTTPSSTASTLTPLQEYESKYTFFDDGWRDECLRLANEYRASEGVAPLTLADEDVQWCTVQQAAADLAENTPHGHTRMCGIGAQNSGPNFFTSWRASATAVVKGFLEMMWDDEKALVTSGERDPNKDEDYTYIGHYLNMRNSAYTKLSCGIALTEDGTKGWFNMNFYW